MNDVRMLMEHIRIYQSDVPGTLGKSNFTKARACLRTLRTANIAEFSFHARRACEGVLGIRQANGTKQGAKRR
ncbi:hypothetical protein [Paenibacillus sp. FSL H8-0537]|uniref:hypothetical protein n=1 Tax=Paenibacillus sp. FSL H8-0537 TaxID=2921399 RepID=UPI0031011410